MLLVPILAAGLGSCATAVVSADPHLRLQARGDRFLRLYMERVKIAQVADIRSTVPQVCFECGDDGDLSNATLFQLPFFATNNTSEPWLLTGDRFRMERLDRKPGELARSAIVDHGVVVANIAPRSTARFSILASLVGSEGIADESDLNGTYRLTVVDEEGEPILERVLSVGYFSQPLQLLRFLGLFAVGLLAVSAL